MCLECGQRGLLQFIPKHAPSAVQQVDVRQLGGGASRFMTYRARRGGQSKLLPLKVNSAVDASSRARHHFEHRALLAGAGDVGLLEQHLSFDHHRGSHQERNGAGAAGQASGLGVEKEWASKVERHRVEAQRLKRLRLHRAPRPDSQLLQVQRPGVGRLRGDER